MTTNNKEELVSIYTESKQIFKKANMNLRNYINKHKSFNYILKGDRYSKSNRLIKILGLCWSFEIVTINTKIQLNFNKKNNKA